MTPSAAPHHPAERAAIGAYRTAFDTDPAAVASAPGRANLLGEHTDYNDGFVLPTALADRTAVAIGRGGDGGRAGTVEAVSATMGVSAADAIEGGRRGDWLDYPLGCLRALRDAGHLTDGAAVGGLRLAIATTLPLGAGVSSSTGTGAAAASPVISAARLQELQTLVRRMPVPESVVNAILTLVAVLRAARNLLGLAIDGVEIAKLGRIAEREHVGMPCGIMDQMVASLGDPGHALLLDTRDLTHELVPLPAGHRVAVVHCGVGHKLVEGGYEQRVWECQAACRSLEVASLRELATDDLPRIEALENPLNRRARHVVTENQRTLEGAAALSHGDPVRFGKLMIESHLSQRDDYRVSIPEIDALVDAALMEGALGARLTHNGVEAKGQPWPREREARPFSTCALAFSESWTEAR